ncbi:MAG: ABC transporter [Methylocystaceae bacterium]|nr:MAG: ABC transporter [Methylocystaceae bacterium]
MPSGFRIELRGVTHRFGRSGAAALEVSSLEIAPAERVAVIGRSGCGKSTLLQIIAGLTKPSVGSVAIDGVEVRAPSPLCTLMFQRPLLFPWLTVAENIALALRFAGRAGEAPARVARLLTLVGLEGRGQARVAELSGGQQQRAALARSLAVEPRALLLDEPFSALDAVTRAELRHEIRTVLDAFSITFVLVTHDVDDALELADRVVVMARAPGRIIDDISIPAALDAARRAALRARLIDSLEPEPAPFALSA